jgi:hypothetical protein
MNKDKCFVESCNERLFITTGKGKYGVCWKCMQEQLVIDQVNALIVRDKLLK